MRGEIGLGDLLRALRAGADAEERRAIARLLGYDVARPVPGRSGTEPAEAPVDDPRAEPGARDRSRLAAPVDRTPEERLPRLAPVDPRPSTNTTGEEHLRPLTPLDRVEVSTGAETVAASMPRDARILSARRPVLRPLISPSMGRTRMADLSSRPGAVGAVDVDRLLRSVVALRPIVRAPRKVRPRVRDRAHFLIDENPAMGPFRRDAEFLLGLLTGLVGTDLVTVRYLFGDPCAVSNGGAAIPADELVIAFTDLGAGTIDPVDRDVIAGRWVEFAAALERAGSELVVLTPFPPARWPAACRARMRIVCLDRRPRPARRGT